MTGKNDYMFFFLNFYFDTKSLHVTLLAWISLCKPGCPETHRYPPTSASYSRMWWHRPKDVCHHILLLDLNVERKASKS